MARRPASAEDAKNDQNEDDTNTSLSHTQSSEIAVSSGGASETSGTGNGDDDEQTQPEPPDERQVTEAELDAIDEQEAEEITKTIDKLRLIVADYPEGTAPEQVVFGRGVHRFHLADLHNLLKFADATD